MVTGVLMAAAMSTDTVAWRDGFRAIAPEEALVHTYVLWRLTDLFGCLVEQPDAIDNSCGNFRLPGLRTRLIPRHRVAAAPASR